MHQSVATIDRPEFINLQPLDINPLMSKCEIKVFYVGENRNQSFISKEVAKDMAKTLRGAPIVGYYKKEDEDFADHGQKVIIDDEGVHFECMTIPYGFVDPMAEVWFQKFTDTVNGVSTEHEYLMTTGYLWTGQFEEAAAALKSGKPQSMELDSETVKGEWSKVNNENIEFFIINDAIISKLCILGDSVEPCFESASVTEPRISDKFTMDDSFKQTLFTMMQDLQNVLQGGQEMDSNINEIVRDPETEITATETTEEETPVVEEEVETEFKKDDKEDQQEEDTADETDDSNAEAPADKKDDEEEKKKKYALLEAENAELKNKYSALEQECIALREFKLTVERQQKEELIEKDFYMLSEEDKADVKENIDTYSLDTIESKLALIAFRKGITKDSKEINETETPTIYTLDEDVGSSLPEWMQFVSDFQNSQNKL